MSTSKLAPDWLHMSEQPIRSQVSKLTKLLTMTATKKFPLQGDYLIICDSHKVDPVKCYQLTVEGDPKRTWSPISSPIEVRGAHSMIAMNNKVLILGGMQNNNQGIWAKSTIEVLSSPHGQWELANFELNPAVRGACAIALNKEEFIVLAGKLKTNDLSLKTVRYNVRTLAIDNLPDMPAGKFLPGCARWGNKIYAAGGAWGSPGVFQFNLDTETWQSFESLPDNKYSGLSMGILYQYPAIFGGNEGGMGAI